MGLNFRISALSNRPYQEMHNSSGIDESWHLTGMYPDVFHVIQSYLNFTYTLSVPEDGQWGAQVMPTTIWFMWSSNSWVHAWPFQNDDGTWTGVIGQLHRKEIDLSPISFTRTKIRSEVVDFSLPVTNFHHRFFIQNPSSTYNWWAYVEPLTLTVWVAVVVLTLILSPVLALTANARMVIQEEHNKYVF